MVNKI